MGVSTPQGLTAVICTHDRPDLLRRALASLIALDPPADDVLVVDNAPSDDRTFQIVSDEFPSVRYVREDKPGLNFARNRAVAESRFAVVAFLDDDAVADRGWCAAFRSRFGERSALGACTGRVEPLETETESQRLFEANGGFSRGLEPIRLPADMARPLHGRRAPAIAWSVSIGCGASMAVQKDAVGAIGGFDTALDMGAVLPGGGDLDMLWRLLDAGYELEYQPEALAWHEHRRDMPSVERQLVGHQRGLLAFLHKSLRQARPENRRAIAMFFVWRAIKPVLRVANSLVGRDPLPPRLLLRMCWNCWVGATVSYRAAQQEAARRVAAASRMGQSAAAK
jgi:GT2 family glycosyltransferase